MKSFGVLKKIFIAFVCVFSVFSFSGCSQSKSENVVRIHIRANSNEAEDQRIKLKVRDNIIDYITPLIASCKDAKEVKNVLKNNLSTFNSVADEVLSENGFDYIANSRITNEYFPTRNYGEKVFEAGYYDALIINLGSGEGNNWWCVAYPPMCFVGEDCGTGNIKYKSKLLELINKFWGD